MFSGMDFDGCRGNPALDEMWNCDPSEVEKSNRKATVEKYVEQAAPEQAAQAAPEQAAKAAAEQAAKAPAQAAQVKRGGKK